MHVNYSHFKGDFGHFLVIFGLFAKSTEVGKCLKLFKMGREGIEPSTY